MNKQSFKEENLQDVLGLRNRTSKSIAKKRELIDLATVAEQISLGTFRLQDLDSHPIKQNPIYTPNTKEDDIVLSKLNHNIKSIYKVKQSDRHTIVKQIISLLKESTPKYIYKLDISEFYESIEPSLYCDKILGDSIISSESSYILKEFLTAVENSGVVGLPRGIGLSSTLSELAMRDFDKKIKSNNRVYFYTRFVDDILIMASERLELKCDVIKHLPKGLNLNWKKTRSLKVLSCYCGESCRCNKDKCACFDRCSCSKKDKVVINFSYLGYKFSFPMLLKKGKGQEDITVGMSQSKINKIRNRIYLSFKFYENSGDYKLLENRIKFLTGNHFISQGKHRTDRMKSGVYYNYIHLTDISAYEELDVFLRRMIFSWKSTKHILTDINQGRLNQLSFVSGFKNKYVTEFSGTQVNKVKGCWNNG
ncbi:antiviral reverse transcriptase Drt3a [Shewanella sp. Isolate8]|uniref:antiviral reverse transcriptase Drt3a n=1 Tax=Shewanella sp. Isolate8 TaxID=2908529 RepID=UPI001EFD106F|nr:antiviral reverse transcriptase Drt3a [Shewanella sp. Isolate8]MCG9746271.1 RNA-directed DNA polymerase [Shewanella sp. Isolate8]